jgi:general secretion pathway protein H
MILGRGRGRFVRRGGGFTVLEMLVAMAILTLVMGTATVLLRPPSSNLQIEASARSLCAALRLTRSRAIATNAELAVTIDLARKIFVSPVISETAFPREAIVEFTVADGQRTGRSTGGFLFFPSGSSTGGDVSIRGPSRRALISINWLTGEARCDIS